MQRLICLVTMAFCAAVAAAQNRWDYNFGSSGPNSGATAVAVVPGAVAGRAEAEVLIVAGSFAEVANGLGSNHIAIFTGSEWVAFNPDDFDSFGGTPLGIAAFDGALYISGDISDIAYTAASGSPPLSVSGLVRWDPVAEEWDDPVGSAVSHVAYVHGEPTVFGGELHVAFNRNAAPEGLVMRMSTGGSWTQVAGGLDAHVFTMRAEDGDLYIGGDFYASGSTVLERAAVLDSGAWQSVSPGATEPGPRIPVWSTKLYDSDLYCGGGYVTGGSLNLGPLLRFDGSAWDEPYDPIHNIGGVFCLDVFDDSLFMAGATGMDPGSDPAGPIHTWDGTSWSLPDEGIFGEVVKDLVVWGDHLYAVGTFSKAGGRTGRNISRYGPFCEPDLTGSTDPNDRGKYGVPDGSVDSIDWFYFLDLYSNGDPKADLSGPTYGEPDGVVDSNDYFYYLDIFGAGC